MVAGLGGYAKQQEVGSRAPLLPTCVLYRRWVDRKGPRAACLGRWGGVRRAFSLTLIPQIPYTRPLVGLSFSRVCACYNVMQRDALADCVYYELKTRFVSCE